MESPFFSSPFTDLFTHFPSAPSKRMRLVYLWVVFHVPILLNSTAEGREPQGCAGRAVLRGTLWFRGLPRGPFCGKQWKPH